MSLPKGTALSEGSSWIRPSHALHAHWDLFSGAAGDMMLAACLDAAGDSSDDLLQEITRRLNHGLPELAGEFLLECQRVWRSRGSLAAKHVVVKSIYQHAAAPVPQKKETAASDSDNHHHHEGSMHHAHTHEHTHSHSHSHSHAKSDEDDPRPTNDPINTHDGNDHSHSHGHTSSSTTNARGPLRNLPEIRSMLQAADETWLPPWVKRTAIQAFTELALAEAAVHGADTIDSVHFHEVGAVDSIVDTVGTLLALWLLNATTSFSCSPLPLGRGTVMTDHGLLPVPAPATLYLMKDLPVTRGPPGWTGELVTPTGAALLRTLVLRQSAPHTAPGEVPAGMILKHIGVGAGTKDFEGHANVVRLMLGELMTATPTKTAVGA